MPTIMEISKSANAVAPSLPAPRLHEPPTSPWKEHSSELIVGALIFAAACFMFFANLGEYPLFNPDESLYAEPAREMLDTGEYVTTLLNYAVRFTKPPLVIWAMALCYKVFGVNEFAARYVGAACAAILVTATYFFANKYAGRRAAAIAAFTLVTAPLFVGTAREAITDMPLSLFMGGALMSFYHGFSQRIAFWRWLGYALVGLAVMTKGPVGLIIPAAVLVLYHGVRGELKAAWSYYRPLAGLAVVAAIAVPWFAVEIYLTKGAYFNEFLVRENFQRFTSVVDHKGAWWYHLAAVAGGYFPWSLFAVQALASVFLQMKQPRSARPSLLSLTLFSFVTFVTIVGFFSASVSKLLPYTLPAFPALAILVGVYLDRQMSRQSTKALLVPFVVMCVASAVALYVVPIFIVRLREMPPELPGIIQSSLLSLLAAAAAAAVGVWIKRPKTALVLFSTAVFACFLVNGKRALDVLSAEWEAAIPPFARFAALSGDSIVVWHMRKPSITFYAGRKVLIPLDQQQLSAAVSEHPGAYVIGKAADMEVLAALPGVRPLVKQGRFVLLRSLPQPAAPQPPAGN